MAFTFVSVRQAVLMLAVCCCSEEYCGWIRLNRMLMSVLVCRWGRVKEDQKWKKKQLIYLSEQVWLAVPTDEI